MKTANLFKQMKFSMSIIPFDKKTMKKTALLFIPIVWVNFAMAQNSFYNFIGQDVFGEESMRYRNSLGDYETESFNDIRHLMYFSAGVEIVYDSKDDKISGIFLLGHDQMWYKPYANELPMGLKWEMTKSEVETLLGKGIEHHVYGNDYVYHYPEHFISIKYVSEGEDPKMETIQIRSFEKNDFPIPDTIGKVSIDMRTDSEIPKITIHDSSQYSSEFIKNLKDITTRRSFELIEDRIIVDNKETMEFPHYPFPGDTLYYAKEYGDLSVYLTVSRVNYTTITYKQQIFKSGAAHKTEEGLAHLNPYDIINGDGFSISEDKDGKMYWSIFFRDQKSDGCFTDIYIGSNKNLAAVENHCVSEFRYNSEKNYITLKQIKNEE